MAEIKTTTFLTSDEIFDLGANLRKLGFAVDTRHLIQAHQIQDLLFTLQVDGKAVTLDRLKTILSPIFCSTPDEQTTFYALFDDWINRQPQILNRFHFITEETTPEIPIQQQVRKSAEKPQRRWLLLAALVLALAIVIALFNIFKPKQQPQFVIQSVEKIGKVVDSENKTPISNAQIFWRNDSLITDNEGCFPLTITNQDSNTRLGIFQLEYPRKSFSINFNRIQDTLSVNDTLKLSITKIKPTPITPVVQVERKKAEIDSLAAVVSRINEFASNEANQVKLKSWQKFVYHYFPLLRLISLVLPLLIFITWLIIRWFRRRIILERISTTRERKAESIMVKGKVEYLYRNSIFRRLVQRFRLHREEPSVDLDVPATVEATIRQGGLFSPLFAIRNILPEYLVLIDRSSFSDQHAEMLDSVIQRMRSDGVSVDRYFFDDDPRICQSDKTDVPHVTLAELLARHPRHRLLIFSDAVHFIDARSGKPRSYLEQFLSWSEPAIFIPDKTEGVEYLELSLKNLGFKVAPANLIGLSRHIDTIHLPIEPEKVAWQQLHHFPELLEQREDIWLERQAPDDDQVELLMGQLKTI